MFIQDKFKSRLKLLRSNNNMSTRALGDAIGVSHTAILQFEKGITLPAVDTLVALADCFDVSVDYLLGVSDEPKPKYILGEGLESIARGDPSGNQKVADAKVEYKSRKSGQSGKGEQVHKQTGQSNIDNLIEGLDEESMMELRKYIAFLRIRQTLDGGTDESSAGLDGSVGSKE